MVTGESSRTKANSRFVRDNSLVENQLKGGFPLGKLKFFDRIEIFFYLTSSQMELNSNLLNLDNRNFGSIEKFRLVENSLHQFPLGGIFRTNRNFYCSNSKDFRFVPSECL